MANQSEKLERDAGRTRAQLSEALEELRARMTPGQVIDQLIDYAREGPGAGFGRNLARAIRENPLPLVLIGIGIGTAWLMVASSRSSRAVIADAGDSLTRKAADISTANPENGGDNGRTRKDDLIAWLRDAHALAALERGRQTPWPWPPISTQDSGWPRTRTSRRAWPVSRDAGASTRRGASSVGFARIPQEL
jgi:hypothetical protein